MTNECGSLPSQQMFQALSGEWEQDSRPSAEQFDTKPGPSRKHSRSMLALILVAAALSAAVTIGLMLLLDLSLLWGIPIYGMLGTVLTLALMVLVAGVSETDT